jgi:hypothetical protein
MLAGCRNKDKTATTHINYDWLFFDFTVTAEEGGENATCVFQFKNGDEEGKAVNISPAKVELDAKEVKPDSARLSGFFYETQKPIDSFAGKHVIVLTMADEKQYRNEFEFSPFTFQEELPQKIHRKPFTIQLKNFPSTEKSVRLLMLDSAFESSGVNDLVPVTNGQINIDQSILRNVVNGPINFELYLEQEMPLKQTTKAGGRISITYGLKRGFELVD